jgi:hypothetical protein
MSSSSRTSITTPCRFAKALAALLQRAARRLDHRAARTAEPRWRRIAIELDRAALKLLGIAGAAAARRRRARSSS